MAFWRRIKQSQIHTKLWNQFMRSYHLQIHHSPVTVNPTKNFLFLSNPPRLPAQKFQFDLPSNVRFFASKKVKSMPKKIQKEEKEEKEASRPRLNEEITDDVVRLVTDEGHSIMSKYEALKLARSLQLDLVEVQRNVTPSVCKLKDYLREKYKQESKEKECAKEKSEVTLRKGACKEIRFSGKITQQDLQVKADTAKRLMERGFRVKCVAIGNTSSENGESSTKLLSRFSALTEDTAIVESRTRVEDKDQIHIILRHVKYGPLKKGSGKNANKDKKSDEEITDADAEEKEKSSWTALDANNDFEQLFDIKENLDNVSKSSKNETWSSAQGRLGSSDYVSTGGREKSQPVPEFPNVLRQPQENMNASPQSSKFSQKGFPPKIPDYPAPSYGLFSAQKNASEKRSTPGEVNRYKQRISSDSQRNYSPPRPMGHGNGDMSSSRAGNGPWAR